MLVPDRFSASTRMACASACALILAACGGSDSGSGSAGIDGPAGPQTPASTTSCDPGNPQTTSECGTVLIAVTDAEGDFTTYIVDLLSISLERADGSRVETLPASTRIDFANLTELAELISAATLVPGDIVGGSIRIDYSNAEIFVEAGGDIVPVQVVDEDGSPLGIVDVDIRLDDRNHLVVRRGRVHFLSVDFDLAASHSVDTSADTVLAVARPFLVAEVVPVEDKELRVRGALVDVDLTTATYDIRVRPWFRRLGDNGVITVKTLPTTEFEIDGVSFVGPPGLEALALQPEGTLTIAFGALDFDDRSFTANVVHAGTSVGGTEFSAVYGNVVARSGDRLVVKGAITVWRDQDTHFRRTVLIDVGPGTGVTKVGAPGVTFGVDDLSVGQKIVAFGHLPDPILTGADPVPPDAALLLDATEGRVRMLATRLTGSLNSILPGEIELTLRGIDRLGIDMFDFTGTGSGPGFDADPLHYQVDTGTLSTDALEVDRPVRVLGFVSGWGAAPPDFQARTLVGPLALRSALGIGWGIDGTAAPFQLMGSTSLVPDLTNPDIGLRHHLLIGDRLIDLFDLPASPGIEPTDERRLFSIWEPGHVELFQDFGEFVDELALRLGASDRARSLAAYGIYNESANTLTANQVVVHMLPAQ